MRIHEVIKGSHVDSQRADAALKKSAESLLQSSQIRVLEILRGGGERSSLKVKVDGSGGMRKRQPVAENHPARSNTPN